MNDAMDAGATFRQRLEGVAAEGTLFHVPEVDLGIPLTWGGTPRLIAELFARLPAALARGLAERGAGGGDPDAPRPVVDTVQDMAVNIDHGFIRSSLR